MKHIFKILVFLKLPLLCRWIFQRDKVTILLFHDIELSTAEVVFTFLKSYYNIIGLQEYLNARTRDEKLPKYSLVITFDDGYYGNYTLLEIIKKLNIPTTIFATAGVVDSKRRFWGSVLPKHHTWDSFRFITNSERLEILRQYDFYQEKEYDSSISLTLDNMIEMQPYCSFQSHTMYHPILSTCSDSEAVFEIHNSKLVLEAKLGKVVNAFSYPFGDYCQRDIDLLKSFDYECGITVDFGFNDFDTDLFRLKRISVNDTSDLNELFTKATGLWSLIRIFLGIKPIYGYRKDYIK